MTLVALTHGYIRTHAMGGEVSLHRTLSALDRDVTVLTRTDSPYDIDNVHVEQIAVDDVLNINADWRPLAEQLRALGATGVLAQNELSLPGVMAARHIGVPSIVSIHTPPRYGAGVRRAAQMARHRIFNTETAKREWRMGGLVLHPPIGSLPRKSKPKGDAITLLSNLVNKGVHVALELARRLPDRRFIIVRSPAEATHGDPDFDAKAAELANVEVHERCAPGEVAKRFLSQTRILIAPSRMETYGMSAIEAAGYGIPSVHIMNAHVREGIGDAAYGTGPLSVDETLAGIAAIESDYAGWSARARARAEFIAEREVVEIEAWRRWIDGIAA